MKLQMNNKDQQIIKDLATRILVDDAMAHNGDCMVTAVIKAFISYYKLDITINDLNYYQEKVDEDKGFNSLPEKKEQ